MIVPSAFLVGASAELSKKFVHGSHRATTCLFTAMGPMPKMNSLALLLVAAAGAAPAGASFFFGVRSCRMVVVAVCLNPVNKVGYLTLSRRRRARLLPFRAKMFGRLVLASCNAIECNVNAVPRVNMSWYRSQQRVSPGNSFSRAAPASRARHVSVHPFLLSTRSARCKSIAQGCVQPRGSNLF